MLIVGLEAFALGTPRPGDTLSEVLRQNVRFDGVGRFVLLPLWLWLTWHWLLRPKATTGEGWPDLVAVALGLLWAGLEAAGAFRWWL